MCLCYHRINQFAALWKRGVSLASHIKEVDIRSYRGLNEVNISDLSEINILVGDNNVGKTSVLEAIQFLCYPGKERLLQIARQRERYRTMARMGSGIVDSLRYLFDINQFGKETFSFDIGGEILGQHGTICVEGCIENRFVDLSTLNQRSYLMSSKAMKKGESLDNSEEIEFFLGKISHTFPMDDQLSLFQEKSVEEFEWNDYIAVRLNHLQENVILNSKMVLTVDHIVENAFGNLIKNHFIKTKAVTLLKEFFDENICDLRIIEEKHRFIPIVEIKNGEYMPLSLYGDGMKKMLTMLNAIVNTEHGVVLIDEFETALHTSAMKEVFSFMADAAEEMDVQLFLTTHSIEAVDKMLECLEGSPERIRVIRLRKKESKIYARIMDGMEALRNREEYNLELRI